MKVKEESQKPGLKLNIQKNKIMAFSPITSWQIDGGTMETVRDFIIWGSKITADGDCSHEIKRCLLLGRKVMTNLGSILGEGNGNPLQYSCLENPMDRGAWCRLLSMGLQRVRHDWTTSLACLLGKVMSLLLNMLSRLVITFFPRSKRLLISRLQSPSAMISVPEPL